MKSKTKKASKLRAMRAEYRDGSGKVRPLNLEQLRDLTGFSVGHLSDVENGKARAGDKLVAALAEVFGRSARHMRDVCNGA